jgi:hypothetical protein
MYSESFARSLNYRLRELELIVNYLESGNEPSRIDIDLALAKTRELYDMLLRIDTSYTEGKDSLETVAGKLVVPSDPDPVQNEKENDTEGIVPDPIHKQKDVSSENQDTIYIKKVPEPADDSMKPENREKQPETDQPDMPAGNKKDESDVSDAKSDKKKNGSIDIEIVADRYQSSQNYINQIMAEKQTRKDLTSRMQSKPILDLRNSIGLNEKFLFIKELFKGRPEKYNQCIDTLNQASSLEEALKFIKNNFSWSEDNDVAEKLINLLKRKHQSE